MPCEPVWLATMTGSVLASVPVSSAAKKYSFQHRMSDRMKAATMPGSAIGRMMRKNAPQTDRPSTSAASSSSIGIVSNWSRMIQITIGSTDQRVEQDQPDGRVEQRQLLVENEERQRQHDRRQDQLRQEEEGDVLVLPSDRNCSGSG